MSKILVIPDQHTHYSKIERIIAKFHKTHKFLFIGDQFDQFHDTPELNSSMASFMKSVMNEFPEWIYLYGNHDVHYHPQISLFCSGYSGQKKEAINEVYTIDDWNKLKYFHFENGWWFSHAGITEHWFSHPVTGIGREHVQKVIDDAVIKLTNGCPNNAIWAASKRRGGNSEVGSITWEDWRSLKFIPNVKQIVGHTPINRITTISDNMVNSKMINVDTSASGVYFSELLVVNEDGSTEILETSYI